MGSQTWVLLKYFVLIELVGLHLGTAQNDFRNYYCDPFRGNYTEDNAYHLNLDDLLYSDNTLKGSNNGYGFYNFSTGQDFDSANALLVCRGDTTPDTCRECLNNAVRSLRQICPNQREATGWYDFCFLRYSNRSLLNTFNRSNFGFASIWRNNTYASNMSSFNLGVASLLDRLRGEAVKGGPLRKYAAGNTSTPNLLTIYGYMQCSPDLSESLCNECLDAATTLYRTDRLGGRVYMPNCVLRFEIYSFYNSTWYPLPPDPGPQSPGPGLGPGPGEDLLPEWKAVSRNISVDGSNHQIDKDDTDEMSYFNLATIQAATNNFSDDKKLGEGGFGPVYKGMLEDGKEIAVKRLSMNSGQGLQEFRTEVRLIVKLQHKNLVRLLGCCIKGHEMLLVYEYMANTSLDAFLFDPIKCKVLDWPTRANIVSGIAKGLRYLHEDSRLKIVHRDMKASNVLLDAEMNPKISDFGTARIFGGKQIEASTNRVVGT